MKKIYFALLAGMVMIACNQQPKQTEANSSTLKETVSIDSLIRFPGSYVGKEVTVAGTVFHTCTETGKRMFIYGTNSDSTLKVVASDSVKTFDKSLEGTRVLVNGLLQEQKVDAAYIANLEKEAIDNSTKVGEKKDMVKGEGHLHEGKGSLNQLDALKKQLKDSGKEYLSFYSLVAMKMEKCSANEAANTKSESCDSTK